MRVVLAPDKFKGSLSADQAAGAMACGVSAACPGAIVDPAPMADGGEGTVEALVAATGGSLRSVVVTGPGGEPVVAAFGLLGDGRTGVLEMAAASGLVRLAPERRDPFRASTRGTGELLQAVLGTGVEEVILGLGGSASWPGSSSETSASGWQTCRARGRLAALGPAWSHLPAAGSDPGSRS
jgi:glycerate kinase